MPGVYVCVRLSNPLEQGLQTVVGCRVGAGIGTQVLEQQPLPLTTKPSYLMLFTSINP